MNQFEDFVANRALKILREKVSFEDLRLVTFETLWQLMVFETSTFKTAPKDNVLEWNDSSQSGESLSVKKLFFNYLYRFKQNIHKALEYVFGRKIESTEITKNPLEDESISKLKDWFFASMSYKPGV